MLKDEIKKIDKIDRLKSTRASMPNSQLGS
jgi:hypothetical protein